ncbi:MAG: DUF4149 domain-containing protein [Acidobacteriota bacterium]
MPASLVRIQAWLAGLWSGSVVALGGVAAPALFSVLDAQAAGQGAGRIFAIEANVSLFFAVVMFILERQRVRKALEQGGPHTSVMSGTMLMILGVLFLTVLGQFAIHPMIEAAKAGQPTRLSFGALHGISASMYWLKALVLLALSWRLTAPRSAA